MFQEGEVKYCPTTKEVFFKLYTHNYNVIREKLPLLENLDPDAIHDIRVTSRRNRALLREFKNCIPPKVRKKCNNEMKNVTQLLGQRRELDVIRQLVISLKDKNPEIINDDFLTGFIAFLDKQRKEEEKNCRLAKNILDKWINLNIPANQCQTQFSSNFCIYLYGKKRIFSKIKKINNAFEIIKNKRKPLDENIHQFRILLKKSRYMMEIYNNIYKEPTERWLSFLKKVQTQLGEWNDYRILLVRVKEYEKVNINLKNDINMEKIQNYINKLLVQKLDQSKKIVNEHLNFYFINKTKTEIKRLCSLHNC
ncbi:MAG TPA: CHAD domain-containing protein [Candidatus Hydrogenedens sp.]|nr:CHAD domain-containing protein [Candidatus Hydrogenedens sp.]